MILSVFVGFSFGHVYIDDEEDLLSEEEEEEETKDHSTTFQERMYCWQWDSPDLDTSSVFIAPGGKLMYSGYEVYSTYGRTIL